MQGRAGVGVSILLAVLALFIGLFGIAVLVGVGEAANNTIVAFAAVSFPFALLTAFFSWLAPPARWAVAAAMSAPVALISIVGSWSSAYLIPGAIWTGVLTCAGAYMGARLRLSRSSTQETPPP